MTEGETRFYLREISGHWRSSNVSTDKLAQLEAARLIEISREEVPAVRLTTEGARMKFATRPDRPHSSIPLVNTQRARRPSSRRRDLPRAKPLV